MSPTPRLSHLQFLILGTLLQGKQSGREIRASLETFDVRRSGPAFYQLMARLEAADLVEGTYRPVTVDGQAFREREYRLRASGRRAWNESRKFSENVIATFGEASG